MGGAASRGHRSVNIDVWAQVEEVEALLAEGDEAPFRLLEHKQLREKFKMILKRRHVSRSLEEMSGRTIDQVEIR